MSYAILRIAKIKSGQQATAKTAHNYREHSLSNVDREAPHPNREYLNHEKRDYGQLADQRIAQVVTRKVRADQVRAIEIIMTGSPEAFKRDEQGRAIDYSKSKWVQDNLHFLQRKYGKENVVSFTLHQDEKTPHIHAVIVPITADGRLAAKELFTPQTLRVLQTEYAQVMTAHGMERGIEHSQTKHQAQRRLYGQADRAAQLVPGPVVVQTVEIEEVPLFRRQEWRTQEEARVNKAFAQQVSAVQERVDKAVEQAQANASAQEQVKTLRKQLATSEGLKQAHFTQLQEKEAELNRLIVGLAQGVLPNLDELTARGKAIREQEKAKLTEQTEQILQGKVNKTEDFIQKLVELGYRHRPTEKGTEIINELTGARFLSKEILPNGMAIGPQIKTAIERTQRQAQKEEQTQVEDRNNHPKIRRS
jgi:hypothetical protein